MHIHFPVNFGSRYPIFCDGSHHNRSPEFQTGQEGVTSPAHRPLPVQCDRLHMFVGSEMSVWFGRHSIWESTCAPPPSGRRSAHPAQRFTHLFNTSHQSKGGRILWRTNRVGSRQQTLHENHRLHLIPWREQEKDDHRVAIISIEDMGQHDISG